MSVWEFTLDAANHVYITGATASQDFPLSVAKPPYQTFKKSTFNVFVTELDPTQAKPGNQLIDQLIWEETDSGQVCRSVWVMPVPTLRLMQRV